MGMQGRAVVTTPKRQRKSSELLAVPVAGEEQEELEVDQQALEAGVPAVFQ